VDVSLEGCKCVEAVSLRGSVACSPGQNIPRPVVSRITGDFSCPVSVDQELDGRIVSSYSNVITTFKDVPLYRGKNGNSLRISSSLG
jgi:hypothetical protein